MESSSGHQAEIARAGVKLIEDIIEGTCSL
jgi:hypothetical protein